MKYNITGSNLFRVFSNIEKELIENSETIDELLKIDHKYFKIKTNLKMLRYVIDSLKSEKLDVQKGQKIIIKYNGDPCITLNLSILAILTKNTVILDYENSMVGINSFIVQTVNNVLKNFETDNLIYLISEKSYEDNNIDKIICIDDINKYNSYLRKNNTKVKFYSFNYLDFYSDSEEHEEIKELIYQFAEENQVPIEVYSELQREDAVQMIKNGLGKSVAILTNNEETKQIFEENIKNKKLYINRNPFEKNKRLIGKDIIFM